MEHVPLWLVEALLAADVEETAKMLYLKKNDEEVIGELSDNTKRIFAALKAQSDAIKNKKNKYAAVHKSPVYIGCQCEQCQHDLEIAISRFDALTELFWASARVDLDAAGQIDIRRAGSWSNWQTNLNLVSA